MQNKQNCLTKNKITKKWKNFLKLTVERISDIIGLLNILCLTVN